MTTATAALAPVRRTLMLPRYTRSGQTPHLECWRAVTLCGEYEFSRLDIPGTPWEPVHLPTMTILSWQSSLRSCRSYVGSGEAAADLERRLAHARGDHDGQRLPMCGAC